jgi:hypothetical protein
LYKFQKINIQITNATTTPANTEEINFRYSGEYIILNITYLWFGGKLSQKVELVRKEMGKKPDEINNPKPLEKKKEVKDRKKQKLEKGELYYCSKEEDESRQGEAKEKIGRENRL